jgi:spore maturation protein CgeB
MNASDVRIVVVGPAWYGDWAKNFYHACLRLGLSASIVYSNFIPASIGGSSNQGTHIFETIKRTLQRISPQAFRGLKRVRQWFSDREMLLHVGTVDPSRETVIVVFTWTPGSDWVLRRLEKISGVILVLWLGEPPVRDQRWETTFDRFKAVFIVDEGIWIGSLQEERNRKRVQLLPLASDDAIFHPLPEVPERYRADVVFVGKYFPSRARSLTGVKDHDLKIYGHGWEAGFNDFPWLASAYRGSISSEELNLVYNGARVAIGTLGTPREPFTTTTMRTFDIALTGTFQVCEEVALTKKLFGDSVGYFTNDEELRLSVEWYLSHEDERRKRGARSRAIAARYTYTEAAKKILATCGIV